MTTANVHDSGDVAIIDIIRAVADARGEAACVRGPGHDVRTWQQFIDRVERASAGLTALGLGCHRERGDLADHESGQDHLALLMHNSVECLELMCAAFASRVSPINVNHRYTADELVDILSYTQATALAVHTEYADVVARALPRLPNINVVIEVTGSLPAALPDAVAYDNLIATHQPCDVPPRASADDLYLVLTGGTTGRPRAVMWRNADAVIECFDAARQPQTVQDFVDTMRPELITLPCAPLMHGAGQWMAMRTLLAGGSVVVPDHPEHFDARHAWSAVERHQVTLLGIVGESFARPLLEVLDSAQVDAQSLNVILTGGAPLISATKTQLLNHLPTVIVVDGFGSSETGGQMSVVSSHGSATSGTFRPKPDRTVVLSEQFDSILQPGDPTVGWLGTTGRLPLGYLNDELKTSQVFHFINGVRYSAPGDHARHLADGSIEALGREAVCINTGGEKVFAEEVEEAVLRHRSVRDCIVVGRPSEVWGSEVTAVISLSASGLPTPTIDELTASMRHLARYKHPKAVVVVDDIRRSPAGKANYGWARAVASSQV